jgi:hypothetical protein
MKSAHAKSMVAQQSESDGDSEVESDLSMTSGDGDTVVSITQEMLRSH